MVRYYIDQNFTISVNVSDMALVQQLYPLLVYLPPSAVGSITDIYQLLQVGC